jgi:hypothetical protein
VRVPSGPGDREGSGDAGGSGDLRADRDLPEGIRYDPDLAVHEPMAAPAGPIVPGRRRSPLLLFAAGLLLLSAVVYALFGLIARETRSSTDYLNEVRVGRAEAWRSAYELSRRIPEEDAAGRDPDLAPQIASLLSRDVAGDARLRRYLVLSLGELRDARSLEVLEACLGDADAETRTYALWGLAAMEARSSAAALAPLLDDADPGVRKMAAYALGIVGDGAATEGLQAALNDPVDEVAWNAALALARLRNDAARPLLLRMLDRAYLRERSHTDEQGAAARLDPGHQDEILINALQAAALLGDAPFRAPAEALRDADPSPAVRQAAIETLRTLDTRR